MRRGSLLQITILSALLTGLLLYTCAPRIQYHFLRAEDIRRIPGEFAENSGGLPGNPPRLNVRGPCFDYYPYVPDTNHLDHYPIKYIRINFHWMQPQSEAADFPEEKVVEFSQGLLKACNYALENNKPMWLPHRNNTPTLPIQLRYILTPSEHIPEDDGIYFHYDDELYYYVAKGKDRNLYDREVITKYGIQLDTVLNLFFMPHHPDSLLSKSYAGVGTGVALNNAIKLAGTNYEGDYWPYRGVINHEMGHIFGLSHAWAYNDGCDDTPRHPQNCWNRSEPGCDTTTSNNVMDYNAMQLAWTPCQIGKVHQRMADLRAGTRSLLLPTWCQLDENKTIVIRDTIVWDGAHDLEGDLIIASGGQLSIQCRVSVPPAGKISVQAGGTLILDGAHLHNACGQEWQGIEIETNADRRGVVQYLKEPTLENLQHLPEPPTQ